MILSFIKNPLTLVISASIFILISCSKEDTSLIENGTGLIDIKEVTSYSKSLFNNFTNPKNGTLNKTTIKKISPQWKDKLSNKGLAILSEYISSVSSKFSTYETTNDMFKSYIEDVMSNPDLDISDKNVILIALVSMKTFAELSKINHDTILKKDMRLFRRSWWDSCTDSFRKVNSSLTGSVLCGAFIRECAILIMMEGTFNYFMQ